MDSRSDNPCEVARHVNKDREKHPPDPNCISPQALIDFANGNQSESEAQIVASHLQFCEACESQLAALELEDPDSFRDLLRHDLSRDVELLREPECQRLQNFAAKLEFESIAPPPDQPVPSSFGRYKVENLLGRGGVAYVYLANDPVLERQVAIKVSRLGKSGSQETLRAILNGARAAVKLANDGLVHILDANIDADGTLYVVMEYIDGGTLRDVLQQGRLSCDECVDYATSIANTLEYLHRRDFVHRDLKPANILIDSRGKTHVSDFDLTLHTVQSESDRHPRAGTRRYMAPEQVRGESHRIDGRTDIWALGVMLYEMLTGTPPFAEASDSDLRGAILNSKPRPPSRLNSLVDDDLERIVLKCLSKNMNGRFGSAAELTHELEEHRDQTERRSTTPLAIAPPGLRSFDSRDAKPFLRLLPGTLNNDGLPESIQFWKRRIESVDGDGDFEIGVLYGPSGCGKSSLVKAGILPRIDDRVTTLYVQASPNGVEKDLQRLLQQKLPEVPLGDDLHQSLCRLRELQRAHIGRKTLIVIDQLEQWLQGRTDYENTELVNALRQCDGVRIQALLTVRDDFWMPLTRFMQCLEVELEPGRNVKAVDLFDLDHAEHVLLALGTAYGRIPAIHDELTESQAAFISQALAELGSTGTVSPVELALFVEMSKHVDWSENKARDYGGSTGLGIAYLQRAFVQGRGGPDFNVYEAAARRVLKWLLPADGGNVRHAASSWEELKKASGYQDRPSQFRELLRVLDQELRLITPVVSGADDASDVSEREHRRYQLTHDFILRPIREWLEFRQRETRRGRAEICLEQRTAAWRTSREKRSLPALFEFVSICLFAPSQHWSGIQAIMMRHATTYHVRRGLLALSLLAVIVSTGALLWRQAEVTREQVVANGLVDRIIDADTVQLPEIIDNDLAQNRSVMGGRLHARLEHTEPGSKDELHLRLALLPVEPTQVDHLKAFLFSTNLGLEDYMIVRDRLRSFARPLAAELWAVAADHGADTRKRLRAALSLSLYDPPQSNGELARWEAIAPSFTQQLLDVAEPNNYPLLRHETRSLQDLLFEHLLAEFRAEEPSEIRFWATAFLKDSTSRSPDRRAQLILESDVSRFVDLVEGISGVDAAAIDVFQEELRIQPSPVWNATTIEELTSSDWDEEARDELASRQANAALSLLRLGHDHSFWPHLQSRPDSRVRGYIVARLAHVMPTMDLIVRRTGVESDASILRALLISMAGRTETSLSQGERQHLFDRLRTIYLAHDDPGVHSAAELLIREIGGESALPSSKESPPHDRWSIDKAGHTMVVIEGPESFLIGSPESESGRYFDEAIHHRSIGRTFAISTKEVTSVQYRRFLSESPQLQDRTKADDPNKPQRYVTWYEAAAYCNWLTRLMDLGDDELCYRTTGYGRYGPEMQLAPDFLQRKGYRLPTETEWEYACRAKTVTSRYYGNDTRLLNRYAFVDHEGDATTPVGTLLPNDFGLFDSLGNLREWVHDVWQVHEADEALLDDRIHAQYGSVLDQDTRRVAKGGSFFLPLKRVRAASRSQYTAREPFLDIGFRVARTIESRDANDYSASIETSYHKKPTIDSRYRD